MSKREEKKTEKQKTNESELSSACNAIEAFWIVQR